MNYFDYLTNEEYQNYTFAEWIIQDATQSFRTKFRAGQISRKEHLEAYRKVLSVLHYLKIRQIEVLTDEN